MEVALAGTQLPYFWNIMQTIFGKMDITQKGTESKSEPEEASGQVGLILPETYFLMSSTSLKRGMTWMLSSPWQPNMPSSMTWCPKPAPSDTQFTFSRQLQCFLGTLGPHWIMWSHLNAIPYEQCKRGTSTCALSRGVPRMASIKGQSAPMFLKCTWECMYHTTSAIGGPGWGEAWGGTLMTNTLDRIAIQLISHSLHPHQHHHLPSHDPIPSGPSASPVVLFPHWNQALPGYCCQLWLSCLIGGCCKLLHFRARAYCTWVHISSTFNQGEAECCQDCADCGTGKNWAGGNAGGHIYYRGTRGLRRVRSCVHQGDGGQCPLWLH